MDLKSMPANSWMLLFGFLIFVPGSTLNAIENTAAAAVAVTTATTDIAKTIYTDDELNKTPSLFRDTINDKTFLKTQSTTPAAAAATLSSAEVLAAAAATTITTTIRPTTSSLARKATNVGFSIAANASLNPSTNAKDAKTTAAAAATTILLAETKSTTKTAPVSATAAVATTTTTKKAKEQVTKAEQLVGRLKPITAKSIQTPNNGDGRFINNIDNNNDGQNDNSVVSSVGNIIEQSSNIAVSGGRDNSNTQSTTKQQQHQHQTRPLQRPNIYYENRHEQQYQQQQQHQLQYQQETQLRQQFTRHVQRADAAVAVAATTTTATTTTSSTTTTYAHNATSTSTTVSTGAVVVASAVDSNLIIADKNIKKNEFETDNNDDADKSNLKAAVVTVATSFATSSDAATITSSISTSTSSSSTATATPATYPPLPTVPATAIKTTTRRPIPTTTLKPPPAIDDYRTITSQAGTHAYLPCNVKQLVKKPISWLRVRDGHILTVDQTTFIADQRFQSIYTPNPERWSLQIKYVQPKDAGTYECQVSTEPKASAIVSLQIVEPKTELIGESSRHVKAGSQVKLRCIISQALEPPLFINWFYNQKQIYLHNRKGWRTEIERIDLPPPPTTTEEETQATTTGSGTTTAAAAAAAVMAAMATASSETVLSSLVSSTGTVEATTMLATALKTTTASLATATADVKQITTASLIIPAVEKLDSGNYTCSPSNSAPRTVVLHVLNGEYSASAIRSGASRKQQSTMMSMMTTIMLLLTIVVVGNTSSQQQNICWHSAATIATILWSIKFLMAKNIWNFCRGRNKSSDSNNSNNNNNYENCHRNADDRIETAQFVGGNRGNEGNSNSNCSSRSDSSNSRSYSTISTTHAREKT